LGLSGGSVTAGTAGSVTAGAGSAFGTGIFLQGNGTTLTFSIPTGIGQTITDVIADQTGSGGAAGNSGSILKVGAGILTLSGENTYTGTTTVSAGTLNLNNISGSATGTSSVIIASSATLSGVGIATGPVALRDGGSIIPAQDSRLALGSLTWDGGGTVSVAIGNTSLPPVQITGVLQKGAAGVYTIGLTDEGVTAGATYTLMTFGSQTGFTASDFTVTGVAGTLSLTGTELRFTTAALPPVCGVSLDATKGNDHATFTLTNTGDTTTSFRLARLSRITGGGHHHGPKPPKPRIELVYLLNGANITSTLEKGTATATLAPGATAQVVVKVKTHGAHRQRTIRVSLSATSVANPSVSATAKVSFVLKANR
jgi:autotransporter-associated beta strand protein